MFETLVRPVYRLDRRKNAAHLGDLIHGPAESRGTGSRIIAWNI